MKAHIQITGDDFNYEEDIDLQMSGRIIEYIGACWERRKLGLEKRFTEVSDN